MAVKNIFSLSSGVINFLDGNLGAVVESSAVAADNYDVTNLLNHARIVNGELYYTHSRNGFRVEYFIKPPVNIIITFPCFINIEKIVVVPHEGCMKIENLEIYSGSCVTLDAETNGENIQNESRKGRKAETGHHSRPLPYRRNKSKNDSRKPAELVYPLKYKVDNKVFRFIEPGYFWHRLASYYSKEIKYRNLVFQRKNFQASQQEVNTYYFNNAQSSFNATHLALRVKRMINSGVVTIGGLEVWGKISSLSPKYINSYINDVINLKYFHRDYDKCGVAKETINKRKQMCTSVQKNSSEDTKSRDLGNETNQDYLPPDFLDAITCDTMCLPMLLPSGYNVDKSTLDKCIEENKKLGRVATDPFTGLPFTNARKPVPNISLKTRMDKFYFDGNSGTPEAFAQSVGTICQSYGTLKNITESIKVSSRTKPSGPRYPLKMPSASRSISQEESNKTDLLPKPKYEVNYSSSTTTSSGFVITGNVESVLKPSTDNHEAELSSSLQLSLSNGLNVLSVIKKQFTKEESPALCVVCETQSIENAWYILPCKHLMCRSCAVQVKEYNKCTDCDRLFCSRDLKRHFVKTGYFSSS